MRVQELSGPVLQSELPLGSIGSLEVTNEPNGNAASKASDANLQPLGSGISPLEASEETRDAVNNESGRIRTLLTVEKDRQPPAKQQHRRVLRRDFPKVRRVKMPSRQGLASKATSNVQVRTTGESEITRSATEDTEYLVLSKSESAMAPKTYLLPRGLRVPSKQVVIRSGRKLTKSSVAVMHPIKKEPSGPVDGEPSIPPRHTPNSKHITSDRLVKGTEGGRVESTDNFTEADTEESLKAAKATEEVRQGALPTPANIPQNDTKSVHSSIEVPNVDSALSLSTVENTVQKPTSSLWMETPTRLEVNTDPTMDTDHDGKPSEESSDHEGKQDNVLMNGVEEYSVAFGQLVDTMKGACNSAFTGILPPKSDENDLPEEKSKNQSLSAAANEVGRLVDTIKGACNSAFSGVMAKEGEKGLKEENSMKESLSPSAANEVSLDTESYTRFEELLAKQPSRTPTQVAPPSAGFLDDAPEQYLESKTKVVSRPSNRQPQTNYDQVDESIFTSKPAKNIERRVKAWFRRNKPRSPNSGRKSFLNSVALRRSETPLDFDTASVDDMAQVIAAVATRSFTTVMGPPLTLRIPNDPETMEMFDDCTEMSHSIVADEASESQCKRVGVDDVENAILRDMKSERSETKPQGKLQEVLSLTSVDSDVFTDLDKFFGFNRKKVKSAATNAPTDHKSDDKPKGPFSILSTFTDRSENSNQKAQRRSNSLKKKEGDRKLKEELLSMEEKLAANLPESNDIEVKVARGAVTCITWVLLMTLLTAGLLASGFGLYALSQRKLSLFDHDLLVDWQREINVAFIGGAYLVINDIPRLTESISNGHVNQNSVLHPSVGSVAKILETGNGMRYQWESNEAFIETHMNNYGYNVASYDFGLCTIDQLLIGVDSKVSDGDTYYDDGKNPCLHDDYYLNYVEGQLSTTSMTWDYIVIADQTKRMAVEDARSYTTESLVDSYAPLIEASGAIPVIVDTHAFHPEYQSVADFVDVPEFQAALQEGTLEYADALAAVLPEGQAPLIAPIGLAYLTVYEEHPSTWKKLFASDNVHASVHGSYLFACVLYATLYGHLPEKRFSTHNVDDLFAVSRKIFDQNMDYPSTKEANYYRSVARRVVLRGHVPASLSEDDEDNDGSDGNEER
jgi:hypothetical protein